MVIGGAASPDKVVEYTEDGVATSLAGLNTGRQKHACSTFVNDDGETVSKFTEHNMHLCS